MPLILFSQEGVFLKIFLKTSIAFQYPDSAQNTLVMNLRILLLLLLSALPMCSRDLGSTQSSLRYDNQKQALEKNSDLYLPNQACDINVYERVGGLQDLERFYSFQIPISDVGGAVDEITDLCDKQMKRKYTYQTSSTLTTTFHWPAWTKSTLSWWTPDTIVRGFYKGTTESYGIQVWADLDKGKIFVYQND